MTVFLLVLWWAGGVVWSAQPEARKPSILIIWGDDIGWYNVGTYNQGVMGYRTPNIDRLAKEGAKFTDWYGQQSCTAGRAASSRVTPTASAAPMADEIDIARRPVGQVTWQYSQYTQ